MKQLLTHVISTMPLLAAVLLAGVLGVFCVGTSEAGGEAEPSSVELEEVLFEHVEHHSSRHQRRSESVAHGPKLSRQKMQDRVELLLRYQLSEHAERNGIGRPLTT